MSHHRFSFCAMLALASGCFGSSSSSDNAASTSSSGPAGSMMGSSSSNGGVPSEEAVDACSAACEADASCRGVTAAPECTAECLAGVAAFGGACGDLIVDEASCIGSLSCSSLADYEENRRDHPECGGVANELIATCTINDGVPPAECERFCNVGDECGVSQVSVETCADNCLFVLTGLDREGGAACADVQRRAFGCFAEQNCADLQLTLEFGSTPPACESFEVEFALECS